MSGQLFYVEARASSQRIGSEERCLQMLKVHTIKIEFPHQSPSYHTVEPCIDLILIRKVWGDGMQDGLQIRRFNNDDDVMVLMSKI